MPYESGSRRVRTVIHVGNPVRGKTAPDRKRIGIVTKLMTVWKLCVDFMEDAIATPNADRPKANTAITPSSCAAVPRLSAGHGSNPFAGSAQLPPFAETL
jgi:hypothetical protein